MRLECVGVLRELKPRWAKIDRVASVRQVTAPRELGGSWKPQLRKMTVSSGFNHNKMLAK